VIGSRLRKRKRGRGGDKAGKEGGREEQQGVWQRLFFGEGYGSEEDEEEDEHGLPSPPLYPASPSSSPSMRDTGDALILRLHSLYFPYVSKLAGSFSNLLDFLLLSPSHGPTSFTPSIAALRSSSTLIEHHDSLVYERHRRKEWTLSSLPPTLYTTAGLQRPVVFPSSSPSSDEEDCYWPRGMEGLPLPRGRRLRPEEMLRLAETTEIAKSKGHRTVVHAINEMVFVQKKMIERGMGGEGEEEEPLGLLLSRISDGNTIAGGKRERKEGGDVEGGGGKEEGDKGGGGVAVTRAVLDKAAHLLNRADSLFGRVVVKNVGGAQS